MRRQIPLRVALCIVMMAGASFARDKGKDNDTPKEDYMTASDGVKIHYYVKGRSNQSR